MTFPKDWASQFLLAQASPPAIRQANSYDPWLISWFPRSKTTSSHTNGVTQLKEVWSVWDVLLQSMDKYESSALPIRGHATDLSPHPQCRSYQESLLGSVLKMRVRETKNKGASIHALHSQMQKYVKRTVILERKCGSEGIGDGTFSSNPNR